MAKKILVVEGRWRTSDLRLYLEREGYEVVEAENGAAGINTFHKENPDMILLDVMMPLKGRLAGLPGNPQGEPRAHHHDHRQGRDL